MQSNVTLMLAKPFQNFYNRQNIYMAHLHLFNTMDISGSFIRLFFERCRIKVFRRPAQHSFYRS